MNPIRERALNVLAPTAAAALGLAAGALLAEAAVLVLYWRSLEATQFLDWYSAHAGLLFRFFAPLEITAALLALAAAGWSHPLGLLADRQARVSAAMAKSGRRSSLWPALTFAFGDRAIGAVVSVTATLYLVDELDRSSRFVGAAMGASLAVLAAVFDAASASLAAVCAALTAAESSLTIFALVGDLIFTSSPPSNISMRLLFCSVMNLSISSAFMSVSFISFMDCVDFSLVSPTITLAMQPTND